MLKTNTATKWFGVGAAGGAIGRSMRIRMGGRIVAVEAAAKRRIGRRVGIEDAYDSGEDSS
ncbi:hypothetical protein [Paludisphaera sp.]|uniref:hypothetical protein n=1 Tax=Paludisphaera sp. TaxID=2017432 RepID=UPI00301C5BDB